jgi:hypothetical protein
LAPGHIFRLSSAVERHHDRLWFAWEMVSPDGDVTLSGIDFGNSPTAGGWQVSPGSSVRRRRLRRVPTTSSR